MSSIGAINPESKNINEVKLGSLRKTGTPAKRYSNVKVFNNF